MEINIKAADGVPIYRQLVEQIKNQIISGELKKNEPLPSIRGFAKDLRISVITTKRAYEELEREGYIYTMSGKGSFVAEQNSERIKEEYMYRIEEHMREIIKLAKEAGINDKEIISIYEAVKEEE